MLGRYLISKLVQAWCVVTLKIKHKAVVFMHFIYWNMIVTKSFCIEGQTYIVHMIDVYTSLVYSPLLKYVVVRLYNNHARTIFSCKKRLLLLYDKAQSIARIKLFLTRTAIL